MVKTVAILQGWAGGPWHTKMFVTGLKEAGFKHTKDAKNADIIVAHSTGCYGVPKNAKANLILLMGPPYWPDKSLLRRVIRKKRNDTKHVTKHHGISYTLKKSFWELAYIFLKPSYTLLALLNHRHSKFLEHLKDKKLIMVRNREDNTSSPDLEAATLGYSNIKYLEMPGHHDDYYTNPKPYIDLLLKEL